MITKIWKKDFYLTFLDVDFHENTSTLWDDKSFKSKYIYRKKLRVARKKAALINSGKIDFDKHAAEFKSKK